MTMEQPVEKYKKVIGIMKSEKPVLTNPDEIVNEVLNRITAKKIAGEARMDLIDFVFSWIYIKWVRRSLVAASVLLVIVFVIQQSLMLKQIQRLSNRIESYENGASIVPGEIMEKRMLMLRFSEKRLPFLKKNSPDKQVDDLFRTIDQLKKEYKNLDNQINEDPELKKLIEEKLSEISGSKIKL
jgi:hypothetical protein